MTQDRERTIDREGRARSSIRPPDVGALHSRVDQVGEGMGCSLKGGASGGLRYGFDQPASDTATARTWVSAELQFKALNTVLIDLISNTTVWYIICPRHRNRHAQYSPIHGQTTGTHIIYHTVVFDIKSMSTVLRALNL